ncbi:MAG: type I DNA topoisomerase [Lachnospiraceae bacterium]|nr:type I DNA topoisomerase [Lachnospiraceae bacterium]
MAKNLVIVESPSKATTIQKFLGKNYDVVASMGHVRDLPKSTLGVDVENDYEPKYITIRGKGELLQKLRAKVKKADKIYLATDPDREGEAISWHLAAALKLDSKKSYRITFNEITKNAVKAAIKNARDIDMNRVDAQQARRVLDRMVGYRISPLLWIKVKRGLSAGRVQSVALRIIADREEDINNFIPSEYWSISGEFKGKTANTSLTANFYGSKTKKMELKSREEVDDILEKLKGEKFEISEVKVSSKNRKAPLPFTTSTLQQEAGKTLNFSTNKTMSVAQSLYEGVAIKKRGTIGLISYLRTDSTRISDEAKAAAEDYIRVNFGEDFLSGDKADKKKKETKKIQDAHEAIRPTYVDLTPASIKEFLTRDQFRLYQLIWRRFLASQMADAVIESTSIKIDSENYRFTTSDNIVTFEGYLNVYQSEEDKLEGSKKHKKIEKGMKFNKTEFAEKQHFTQPPAHFTEASLVKTLEEMGIGRPSTYAPTITTIIKRHYVAKENKHLYITELGEVVTGIMKTSFPSIVDVDFTANFEALLDGVEEGDIKWKTVIENFYPDLESAVKKAEEELEHVEIHDEVSDEICEVCGRNMVVKYGPFGKFLACPGFPECKNTKPYFEKTGITCPKCGADIVIKKTRKGRRFYGCITFPECDFVSWQKPSQTRCPKCGGFMVEKGNKLVCMSEDCEHVMNKAESSEDSNSSKENN